MGGRIPVVCLMRQFISLVENAIRGVPEDVVEQYSYGDCMWLALALHNRYGWPIRAQMHRDAVHGDYVAHAYCVMPDGRECDILGPQEHVDPFGDDVQDWDAKELLATMVTDPSGPVVNSKLADADAVIDRYIVPKLGPDDDGK